jgi:hypothetical protein
VEQMRSDRDAVEQQLLQTLHQAQQMYAVARTGEKPAARRALRSALGAFSALVMRGHSGNELAGLQSLRGLGAMGELKR